MPLVPVTDLFGKLTSESFITHFHVNCVELLLFFIIIFDNLQHLLN